MIVVILFLSLLMPGVVSAEGFRFVNGRLDAGPESVLDLSDSQRLQPARGKDARG